MKYRKIILYIALFFSLWIIAWIANVALSETIWPALKTSHNVSLLYWSIMKVLIWVVVPFFYAKKFISSIDIKSLFGLQNIKKGFIYGLAGTTVFLVGSHIIAYITRGQVQLELVLSPTLIWVITGTPISEEFNMRGIVQTSFLKNGMRFWPANIIASLIFLLIHIVGWSFQGGLSNLLQLETVGSILIVSLFAGWLRYKSNSLYSGIILHAANNFFSSILIK